MKTGMDAKGGVKTESKMIKIKEGDRYFDTIKNAYFLFVNGKWLEEKQEDKIKSDIFYIKKKGGYAALGAGEKDKVLKNERKEVKKRMLCKNCNTEVNPKLNLNWPFIVITALLFWPATAIYFYFFLETT